MYDLLVSFYKYGFVVIKNIPTSKNYIVEFANSIGSVRRTNFGEYFDVKSKPDPNDLAYTSRARKVSFSYGVASAVSERVE